MRSAIYKGFVWHQRFQPTEHSFRYRVFMMYLDLAEQDVVLRSSLLWGTKWYHLARFKRTDYFALNGDTTQSIDAAVRQEVGMQLGQPLTGPVCLLTNFRYCGYTTNPISCYYCFNADATSLVAMLIEVTNTPWGEKHHYVLDLRAYTENDVIEFEKKMHVSPFMPMNRKYRWRGSIPTETLRYSLASVVKFNGDTGSGARAGTDASTDAGTGVPQVETDGEIQFDSGVVFKRIPVSGRSLGKVLFNYPLMTLKVILAIYWQALKLWIKKVPFLSHPSKSQVPS